MKHMNGKIELRGGTAKDQREARAWAEKFIPKLAATLPHPSDQRKK